MIHLAPQCREVTVRPLAATTAWAEDVQVMASEHQDSLIRYLDQVGPEVLDTYQSALCHHRPVWVPVPPPSPGTRDPPRWEPPRCGRATGSRVAPTTSAASLPLRPARDHTIRPVGVGPWSRWFWYPRSSAATALVSAGKRLAGDMPGGAGQVVDHRELRKCAGLQVGPNIDPEDDRVRLASCEATHTRVDKRVHAALYVALQCIRPTKDAGFGGDRS